MPMFEAVFNLPTVGKVKHFIRAPDARAAREKASRVHRNAISIAIHAVVRDPQETAPTYGMSQAELHQHNLEEMLRAIPPEGATLNDLHNALGRPVSTLRQWSAKLVRLGLISREPCDAMGTLLLKKLSSGKEKACAGS